MGIYIENGGLLTTVQDYGRTGYQRFGVPVSGVVDYRSMTLANLLVGNDMSEAVLEATILGPRITFTEDNVIAVTGGDLSPRINTDPLPMYRAIAVNKGDTLSFGRQKTGCRAMVAFSGGLDIPPVMGSRSTYIRANLGGLEGRKLQKGDKIAFRNPVRSLPNMIMRVLPAENFAHGEKSLRVVLGPQDDCFTQEGLDAFLGSPYSVTRQFDRMGCRLEGKKISHTGDGNIISDGISLGAIQVPSTGLPIIMLSDRQTIGGYTKIANVIRIDLPVIAQCHTGDLIRFTAADIEEAQRLYLAEHSCFTEIHKRFASKISEKTTERVFNIKVNGRSYHVTVDSL